MANPIAFLRRLSRRFRAGDFLRARSGATAVEFALVAAPLLFMLFSIIELALVFMVSSSLENATTEAARRIRTGATQGTTTTQQTAFRNTICAEIGWMQANCQANLSVDVWYYNSFAGQTLPPPTTGTTFNYANMRFNTGAPGDIVLVRSFYRWKLVSPFLKGGLERLSGGVTLLTAAATFRNEPFTAGGTP